MCSNPCLPTDPSTSAAVTVSVTSEIDCAPVSESAPSDITPIGIDFSGQKFENVVFRKDKSRRSFQPHWCQTYPWIEYSFIKDAIFCNVCRNFAKIAKDYAFTHRGYRNWSEACAKGRGLDKHNKSIVLQNAMLDQAGAKLRSKAATEVSSMLNANALEKRQYYIASIIDIVILLSSRELAFRGSWEKDACEETGIFNALFKFTLEKDEKLRQCHKLMPRNALYTSPQIQNELISTVMKCTRDEMVKKINTSEYLTLFSDGTKDRNGLEVISIALRYVIENWTQNLLGISSSLLSNRMASTLAKFWRNVMMGPM